MAPAPSPRPPCVVTVYDGRDALGFILARGTLGFEAFDVNDRSLGVFATMKAAADAISSVAAQPERGEE